MSNKTIIYLPFLQYVPENIMVNELYYDMVKQRKIFDINVFDINEYIKKDSIIESVKLFSMFTKIGISIFDKNVVEKINDMIAEEAFRHLTEMEIYDIDSKILFIKFQIKNCRNQFQKLNLEDALNKLTRERKSVNDNYRNKTRN